MYPEVRGEMARRNITLAMIVENKRVNCTVSTLSQKLNGKYPLTFNEAIGIKEALNSELPLEELFRTEADVCE